MRRLPSTLLLVLLGTLLLSAPAEARKLAIGVNADTLGWGTQMGARQELVAGPGFRWVREELTPEVAYKDGPFNPARFDALFVSATHRKLRVLPLLMHKGGAWPADHGAFASFVARMAGRYGPGGSFWLEHPELDGGFAPTYFEVWNEPYYPFFSSNRVDPARYADLFVRSVQAGRAANPRAKYMIAGTTDAKTWEGRWVNWTDALFAGRPDLAQYVDAVTMHPYSGEPTAPLAGGSAVHSQFRRVKLVHDKWVSRGVEAPFWLTEFGWSTCPTGSECVSEAQQASYLKAAIKLAADEWGFVEGLVLYNLQGWPGAPDDKEAAFGLLRADGTTKPAWNAVQQAVAEFGAEAVPGQAFLEIGVAYVKTGTRIAQEVDSATFGSQTTRAKAKAATARRVKAKAKARRAKAKPRCLRTKRVRGKVVCTKRAKRVAKKG